MSSPTSMPSMRTVQYGVVLKRLVEIPTGYCENAELNSENAVWMRSKSG
jgi:hypothetical protein